MVDSWPMQILSRFQTRALLAARERGESHAETSLDLGVTRARVSWDASGIDLPTGGRLVWEDVERVDQAENVCFRLVDGSVEPIRGYSEETHRTYQLMPTEGAPALLISGFVMHRIRDVSPDEGAARMVRALGPIRGRLLDTATGLGYAAIAASRHATAVVTIELDPWAQEMARQNPWSNKLFVNEKITQWIGDSSQLIENCETGSFSCVLHDPPAINLAGELYAEAFYGQVWRVLSRGGRFFHYIGDPTSASGGRVTQGVLKRLTSAGFSKVTSRPEAFGVLAYK